ncbi:conserved hypothetical protein [Ricinus communis]|uniref:Uncharacterized protein n=1 Tax=Ricinus communis TaxID=3988 RepID=B9RJB3_RICCO|nr:conserved hypothetical protein [Ricinus communis]
MEKAMTLYSTRFKERLPQSIKEEFGCLMSLPPCSYGVAKAISDLYSMNKLMQFRMGLNDCYDHTRNQILVMDPFPTVNRAYFMLLSVEKQREIHNNYNKDNMSKRGAKKKDKENKFCDHCRTKGHERDTCFKIHGVPDWYKELREQQKKEATKSMANMAETPLDFDNAGETKGEKQNEIANMV